jgi:hypothetical protein
VSDILTERETVVLMENLVGGRTSGTATLEELDALLTWAKKARIGTVALEMALAGEIRVDVIEGEVRVGLPWRVHWDGDQGVGGFGSFQRAEPAGVGQPHTLPSYGIQFQVTGYKPSNFLPQTGTAWEKKWKTKSRRLMHLRGLPLCAGESLASLPAGACKRLFRRRGARGLP